MSRLLISTVGLVAEASHVFHIAGAWSNDVLAATHIMLGVVLVLPAIGWVCGRLIGLEESLPDLQF